MKYLSSELGSRTNFSDFSPFMDMNAWVTPFAGNVRLIKNGPEGISSGTVIVLSNDKHAIPAQHSFCQTQIVISDDSVFFRRNTNNSFGSWNSVAGGSAGDSAAVSEKISFLESQIKALKQTDIENVEVSTGTSSVSQPSKDIVLTTSEPVTDTKFSVTGKSVEVNDSEAVNSVIHIKAESGDVRVSNLTTSGVVDKATMGNAQVLINSPSFISVSDSTLSQEGYNGFEIANMTPLKSVNIDNVVFSGKLENNGINFFKFENNAVVTISNCIFENVSNAFRISNALNAKNVKFKFINCKVLASSATVPYVGFVILQDFTSGSYEAALEAKQFGPEKLTLEFVNCYTPNGKITAPSDLSKVCGSKDNNQLIYIWAYTDVIPYSVDNYPNIIFG